MSEKMSDDRYWSPEDSISAMHILQFGKSLDNIGKEACKRTAETIKTLTAALAERDDREQALQAALIRWLPQVFDEQSGDDAMLLVGYSGPDQPQLGEAMRADAERFRWGVENARWIRHDHEAYVAIPVALVADLSCYATRVHAIDAARSGDNNAPR
ncbi:hypothetical protein [Arenimonas sp.]|uniref:hypothetical protein n=1 Tax=Arenimonas sp. TaxID=1872635 RepID=UPI0039E653D7